MDASADGATSQSGVLEFRYRGVAGKRIHWMIVDSVGAPLVVALLVGVGATGVVVADVILALQGQRDPVPAGPFGWAIALGFWVLLGLFVRHEVVRGRRLEVRGLIRLDDDGITVRDGQGEESRTPWSAVFGLMDDSSGSDPLVMETRSGPVELGARMYIKDGDKLVEAIVARAGLVAEQEKWGHRVYLRP